MTALERVSRARSALLLDHPWFGAMALRLRVVESDECQWLGTDGSVLAFNPAGMADRADWELRSGIAHEVLHCALLHPWRIGSRDFELWNVAADYAINALLAADGFKLWPGALIDPKFAGMGAEQIYALLLRESQQGAPKPQMPEGQPDMSRPAPKPAGGAPGPASGAPDEPKPALMTETDWQIAAEQVAAIGRKAGSMPGGVDRAIKDSRASVADWREILREFVTNTVPSDYSWLSPSRAYLGTGLYQPGVVRENMGRIAVGVDTSGSITDELLATFGAELTAIAAECRPEALDVVYCHSRVCGRREFGQDEPVILERAESGGTAFQPVFDELAGGELPACLVYFTDLEGPAPRDPGYPVLWVTTAASRLVGPFGQTVRVAA